MKGIFPHPDLNDIMKPKRFKQIKTCFADSFVSDAPKADGRWAPIVGNIAENDEWAQLQGLVNDFNKTVKRNYSESDQKCLDESMSPWKPQSSATGNLPHLSYIMRKPKEFKLVACAATGIMLHLEIQQGKASGIYL